MQYIYTYCLLLQLHISGMIKYRILRHQKTVHVILSVQIVYHRLRHSK